MFTAAQKEMFQLNERRHGALIRGFFRYETMLHGYRLYQSGAVQHRQVENEKFYMAEVAGDRLYEVKLRLDFLPHSRCQCGYRGSCQHMAAVMLDYLAQLDIDLLSFIEAAYRKSMGGVVPNFTNIMDAEKQPLEKTKAESWGSLLVPHADVEQWHKGFRQLANQLPPGRHGDRFSLIKDKLFAVCGKWEDSQRAGLFKLHALLYLMAEINETRARVGYLGVSENEWNGWLKEQFITATRDLSNERLETDTEDQRYVQGLAHMLARYAFAVDHTAIDWLFFFRFLWYNFPSMDSMKYAERKRLIADAANPDISPVNRERMLIAAAHFHVMEGRDQKAIREIGGQLEHVGPYVFYDYLELYRAAKHWEKLRMWLDGIKSTLKGAPEWHMRHYFSFWKDLTDSRTREQDAADMEAVMIDALPNSASVYQEHLLQCKRYDGWVDFQLFMGTDPTFVEYATLTAIGSSNPALLLPYYHQWIFRWIEEKNRHSYKDAVRWMKRLRALYKKLKREAEFERYLQMVLARYARLRALHEEMRKGKLVV